MQTLRRISQGLFLSLFVLLFLLTFYPLKSRIPVDLFFRLDPLTAITSGLASRTFYYKFIPAIFILILTIVFGRFFCGWICPLGSTIDVSDRILLANRKKQKQTSQLLLKWFKYALLIAVSVAAVFSVQIAGFLDPISILTRTVVTVVYPLFVLTIESIFGILFQVVFLKDGVFHIHEVLQKFLLPISPRLFRGSVLIGIIFLLIILLSFYKKRFWCCNICPLGGLFGLFSKFRWYRRRVSEDCTECKICFTECRMGAICPDFKSTDHPECINCMDCQKICPAHAIRFGFISKPTHSHVDISRRRVLGAGLTGIISLGLMKIDFINPSNNNKIIRPPGAWEEAKFLDRCIRCGECIRICYTSGSGLHFTGLEGGWEGLATPMLLTPTGYCEFNCNLCGQVCPTGAINSLSMDEKHQIKMGTAFFNKNRCIPWYYGDNCMVCEEHCPVPEKAIKFREEKVKTLDGSQNQVLLPYVNESLCIGCGLCTTVCPLTGEKGIFLNNDGETRRRK